MKEKLTPKAFMKLLMDAVKSGKITQQKKTDIEIECAYIQYQNPSELLKTMENYLRELGIKDE